MERLLTLRLQSIGCAAEAWLNGVPLLRVDARQPLAWLPVHEYTLAGANALRLVVYPQAIPAPGQPEQAPQPMLCDGCTGASVRLLLPRLGASASPASARTLGQIDWAPHADELCLMPVDLQAQVDVPVGFPRWRWADAPAITMQPATQRDLSAWLLDIAVGLARGNAEPLVQASRLRLEDLAVAYARPLTDLVAQLRQQVRDLHAAARLQPRLPTPDTLQPREIADGRLLDCLGPDGSAWLRSPRPTGWVAWPLRVAFIDGRPYGLR